MHVLGLVNAERKEPFYNFGGHPVSTFQDITIDGQPLLLELETASGEHFDVVSALTSEFPSAAVEFLDDLRGTDTTWRVSMGWDTRSDEVPIYFCQIDYDILCTESLQPLSGTDDQIRMHQFRHTSTDEPYSQKVTEAISSLDFTFALGATDPLLDRARATFDEEARNWVTPTGKSARSGAGCVDASSELQRPHPSQTACGPCRCAHGRRGNTVG